MNLLTFISLAILACPLAGFAGAVVHAPFHNEHISPGDNLFVEYDFDADHQIMICKTSSYGNPGFSLVHWASQGAGQEYKLPNDQSMVFKNHARVDGFAADAKGGVDFFNQSAVKPKSISCEYQFVA